MTKNITPQCIEKSISNHIGYPTSCTYNKTEDRYILYVFMVPNNKKEIIEDQIYNFVDCFKENGSDIFMPILVFTEEETRKYYPDKVPKASIAPQMILSKAAQ